MRLPSAWQDELLVKESSCLGLQLKAGGKFHLKLNIGGRPIAYKYREGKMQQNFEKRVKEYLKLLKGKRRKPVFARSYFPGRLRLGRCVQQWFCLVVATGRACGELTLIASGCRD